MVQESNKKETKKDDQGCGGSAQHNQNHLDEPL